MKLSVTFKNGETDTAYLSGEKLKRLQVAIMAEFGYERVSDICDEDYAIEAINMHRIVRVFAKQYNENDVVNYQVNRKTYEPAAHRKKRIKSYLTIYPEALEYAESFFRDEARRFIKNQQNGSPISGDVLPITFITDGWDNSRVNGDCIYIGKQAAIHVLLQEAELSDQLKEEIRHEILHYILWLTGLPCEDDASEFWALAILFDADPYELPKPEKMEYVNAFMEFYRNTVMSKEYPRLLDEYVGKALMLMSQSETIESYINNLDRLKATMEIQYDEKAKKHKAFIEQFSE